MFRSNVFDSINVPQGRTRAMTNFVLSGSKLVILLGLILGFGGMAKASEPGPVGGLSFESNLCQRLIQDKPWAEVAYNT